ncbi:MAG TPA: GNAT family N-acetyltransferase [Stellaceae bacterium]|nr:GNAT family N-acetyltransferase [Stellaceae bacterium]
MHLRPGLDLSFEDNPSPHEDDFIGKALGAYSAPFLRDPSYAHFGLFVRSETREIHAGLIAHVYAGWLFIKYLWVQADLRRGGVGSALIAAAEQHAREFGCHSAWVDTFSFQAPDFYPRFGYREFARLDYPPDHQRIFFQKRLT